MEIINITAHNWQTAKLNELAAALAKFHEELSEKKIKKDQVKTYKDRGGNKRELKYAGLDSILKQTRPLLAKNGLSVVQSLAGEFLSTILIHSSGQQLASLTPFEPMKGNGTSSMQDIGGGITYLKRYCYNALLNISVEDDKDGDDAPEKKQTFTLDRIEDGANIFLKTGTLSGLERKYFIPENIKIKIYFLAKELKEKILKEKKASEAEKEQAEPVNN